jgi:hypothetical protein
LTNEAGAGNKELNVRHQIKKPIQQGNGDLSLGCRAGVLAENIFLFLQNRRLNDALAPQISLGRSCKCFLVSRSTVACSQCPFLWQVPGSSSSPFLQDVRLARQIKTAG